MKKFMIILCLIFMVILGCAADEDDGYDDCQAEIDSLISERGNPEEIERYDTDDYHDHTYWYWSEGYSKTFTWGEVVGGCEVSTYTFSPIN